MKLGRSVAIVLGVLLFSIFLFGNRVLGEIGEKPVKKKVLILQSYSPSTQWSNRMNEGLLSVLNRDEYSLYIEYMDTKRYNDDVYIKKLYEVFKYKYSNSQLDAVICVDNDALQFVVEYGDELFGDVPTFFCGINHYSESLLGDKKNITGVAEQESLIETLDLINKQNPNLEELIVLSDTTTTGVLFEQTFYNHYNQAHYNFEVTYINNRSMSYLLEMLSNASGHKAILIGPISKDADNDFYDMEDIAKTLSRELKVPGYSLWDINLGEGLVGGKVVSPVEQGKEAGLLAVRYFEGEPIESIEVVTTSPNRYIFDKIALEKYGILERSLPKDSIIINKKLTLFETNPKVYYGILFVSLIGIIVVLTLWGLFYQSKDRNKRLDFEIEEKKKALEEQNVQMVKIEKMAALGDLVAGVSHEINTPLGVSITANSYINTTILHFEDLLIRGEMTKQDLEKMMETIIETSSILTINLDRAADLVKSFKQIAVDQNSIEKNYFDLYKYIETILTSLKHEYKRTKHSIKLIGFDGLMIESYPSAYIAIITNFIMNSLKHGFDGKEDGDMFIEVSRVDNMLHLKYWDEGIGISEENLPYIFDPFFTTKRGDGTGLGLNIVYQIVTNQLNGTIECRSVVGEGTTFDIRVPMTS